MIFGVCYVWRPDQYRSIQCDRLRAARSILDMACTTGWLDPQDEAKNLALVRAFYRDLFAESGASPCPARPTMERSSIIPTLISQTPP
jgi:hypothetical protein